MPDLEGGFAELAVEHWRLIRVLERLVDRLPVESQARVAAQVRFAGSRLDTLMGDRGFTLTTFDGRRFEANLPVIAVNADDFAGGTDLTISDTVEPAVVIDGRVVKLGRVILSCGDEDAPRN